MSPPRLLYMGNAFSVGGLEVLALDLFRRLHPVRFEIEAVCLKERGTLAGELEAAGIAVHSGILKGRLDPFGPGRLARLLAGRRFDLILVEPGRNALLMASIARRLVGARAVVSWIHATGKWGSRSQFNGTERRLLSKLDAVVAIAESQKGRLVEEERLDPGNLVVIHNGVDTGRFRPRPETRDAARAALGVPAGEVAAGIVASLTPEKGHLVLIDAVARAAAGGAPVRLLVAGEGAERSRIEAAVRERAPAGGVLLLGLRRGLEENFYPALDLLVLASHPARETLPISLMEGMACGLPVVATRVGSVADLVADGETGILVPPGDPAAMAAAIAGLARAPERRRALGAAGRERVARAFSIEAMVEDYARLFTLVLEPGGAGHPGPGGVAAGSRA